MVGRRRPEPSGDPIVSPLVCAYLRRPQGAFILYRVFSVILALTLFVIMPACKSAASDWEEDGAGDAQTRIPRPAPPIQRRAAATPAYDDQATPAKTSVSVPPSHGSTGSTPRLEANVSKWGSAEPDQGYLGGSARQSFTEAPAN